VKTKTEKKTEIAKSVPNQIEEIGDHDRIMDKRPRQGHTRRTRKPKKESND